MKQVAKIVIVDENDRYLLLKRSNHPRFPNDPDLPGGTIEAGEGPVRAMLREVTEEVGIVLDPKAVAEKYVGQEFSARHTMYHLYETHVQRRPDVIISWEHASYAWVSRQEFLEQVSNAVDNYMRMVYQVMTRD